MWNDIPLVVQILSEYEQEQGTNMDHGARWGVTEWIERPLLMLEVRGSNPGHSASKNTTSLPRNPRGTH